MQIALNTYFFKEFTDIVVKQKIEWRSSYAKKVSIVIRKYLIPCFWNQVLLLTSKVRYPELPFIAKVTHGKNQNAFHHHESIKS